MAGNPTYSSQSISGFNSDPPADDGTAVAANKTKWADHVVAKVGTPLKNLAEGVNTAVAATVAATYLFLGQQEAKATTLAVSATADDGKLYLVSGTFTVTLPSAATAGAKFRVGFKKTDANTTTVSFATTSSQTIDGATTKTLQAQYEVMWVVSDGSNWHIVLSDCVDQQSFTASGTWKKPSMGHVARIECWGAGASGGKDATSGGGGGGGGGYQVRWILISALAATETVTIGAGGAAVATETNGNNGGNTTFSSSTNLVTAYGGGKGGGGSAVSGGGGGGGGTLVAGAAASGTTQGTTVLTAGGAGSVGGGSGGAASAAGSNGTTDFGGGGGAGTGQNGGFAVYGGGGGGGWNNGNSGTSLFGGSGAAGPTGTNNGSAGTQPGGGGGGAKGTSGAGADGKCVVTVW